MIKIGKMFPNQKSLVGTAPNFRRVFQDIESTSSRSFMKIHDDLPKIWIKTTTTSTLKSRKEQENSCQILEKSWIRPKFYPE